MTHQRVVRLSQVGPNTVRVLMSQSVRWAPWNPYSREGPRAFGNTVPGMFLPILAKHGMSFILLDILAVVSLAKIEKCTIRAPRSRSNGAANLASSTWGFR